MSITPDNLGRGPLIMGLTWSFAVLATIAVGLRFYIRVELNNRPSLDDWLIAVALIFNFVSQSFMTVGFTYGLGNHDANLQPYQIINILKWMWLANTPGLLVAITARLSIAMLLVRLFGKVHKWLKWFLVVVSGLCTVLTAIIIPCTFLQTTPVSGNWNPFQPSKRWNPMIYISLAFLTQSFVIIMGCVPTLGSFTKLKITRPLLTSLDSVLRLINPFKRSTVDRTAKGDGTNSQDYENLEMPKATSDWSDGVYGPALSKSLSSLEGNPQGGYSSTTINDYNYV
ncbi:hypothetical protein TESG_03447 [Trichophyton tonsurans CBS 112818]|uniref:Rhodopsin domain-containing protein n=1 Tax=Trichophyton tonsurans (strain CBS 112818) TaxID=647933 RepID=F2RXF0_TRIT1|nr:hypothetical protein TESG_03447 [Trichophyton tonsurans CBS 112818]